MPSPLPRRNRRTRFAHLPIDGSLPRLLERVGFRITLFEACSAFTHVTAYIIAEPLREPVYIEGFSRVVTSTTAPIATGWSDSCRVGFAPTERPCLCTAHRARRDTLKRLRQSHPKIRLFFLRSGSWVRAQPPPRRLRPRAVRASTVGHCSQSRSAHGRKDGRVRSTLPSNSAYSKPRSAKLNTSGPATIR
jgi:hypothetical protein